MVEDRDSERLTDVIDAVGPDDDPLGMRVGPGTEVGGYIIDGQLGHGGMGVVYSATHPVIRKRAAIKILRPEVSRSPIAVERFIQEARAVNQIGHPNIIDIFAYGALPDGRAYHVMDLLVGESLRRRLKRSVLHPSEAASVIDEIASALMAAHDNGFVHRDLKPDNVFLVSHDGRWPEVKLLDFGLAKLMPEYGVPAFTTKTGVMLGTPEYMSPEQARGQGVDYRTDIYALGILMFEIIAGSRPFPPMGDSLAVLLQHAEEPPFSLADMVADLPAEMVQLVDAMLAKTPEARPSLAAVRTVIKRLRSTQLPTRSVAGMAMSSFSQLPARPELAISASRVGAEAMLPDPLTASARRPALGSVAEVPRTRPPVAAAPGPAAPVRAAPITTPPGAAPIRRAPITGAPVPGGPLDGASAAAAGTGAPQPGAPAAGAPVAASPAASPAGAPTGSPASGSTAPGSPLAVLAAQLAEASPFPKTSKPDTTTRGVGVHAIWASQGVASRPVPTSQPGAPRTSPVGSQPPPPHMASPSGSARANPQAPLVSPATGPAFAPSRPSSPRLQPPSPGVAPPAGPITHGSSSARRWWLVIAVVLAVVAAAALGITLADL